MLTLELSCSMFFMNLRFQFYMICFMATKHEYEMKGISGDRNSYHNKI